MGVRGLQTFLEQYCTDCCSVVDLSKLIQEHNFKTSEPAEIVIDAQSCYNLWYEGIDWVVGFEVQEFIHRLRSFVEAFQTIGAKLVFFFGGLTPEKKRAVWIQRKRNNLNDIYAAFDFITKGNSYKQLPKYINSIPPNMGITTSLILKYILKCEVYLTVDECDEEIIEYAHNHNSFAIFSQDTDFIISDLNAVVLSVKNFNIKLMTTVLYDRVKLAKKLDIKVSELPLLAVLAGNDLIPFNFIASFHRHLCNSSAERSIPFHVLMPALGRYIKALPDAPIEILLKIISDDIFKNSVQVDLVKLSYNSYIIRPSPERSLPEDEWSHILYVAKYRHRNTITPSILFSILNEQVYECSTAFEDLRKINDNNKQPSMLPSSTITRPLRLRLYGVLLHNKKEQPITVSEWCGENVNSYQKPVVVEPVKPNVRHPGLIALWSDDNGDRMNNFRWDLFTKSISPKMKASEWNVLPEDLLLSTASVYYLYTERFINKVEVDAILATIATFSLYNRKKLEKLSYNKLDMRAAQISLTFIRTYSLVLTLLAACGYPIPMSPDLACMKFEGKLFQIKYENLIVKKLRYNDLCEDVECLKIFYKMKNLIYSTPRLPKNIQKPGNQFMDNSHRS